MLHVARNFPSSALPRLGLWTERLVRSTLHGCEAEVIAPVPYWPPLPGPGDYTRFREVARETRRGAIAVHHPRLLVGPGQRFAAFEGGPFHFSIRRVADRLHARRPFDIVHAHFAYPDGWAAAQVAKRYGVPLIVTEHTSWQPRLDDSARIRRLALHVAGQCRFMVAVSSSLARSIEHFAPLGDRLRVIPNVVDQDVFTLAGADAIVANRLLFVGLIRRVKGLDVLLDALRMLLDRGQQVSLAIVGESVYGSYREDHAAAQQQVAALRLESHVEFLGGLPPQQVAREIARSSVLVVSSRRETFATVLVEALACGRPVVATRCGGPEDIVTPEVGVLVESGNPAALADGIAAVLRDRQRFEPERMRSYAIGRFGMQVVGRQLVELYREALDRHAIAS